MISLIAAISKDRVLGKDGKIPWDEPKDRKRFRDLTYKHIVVMGRKTFESIGHPLEGRLNVVITHHPEKYHGEGVYFVTMDTFETIWMEACEDEKVFVIGGQSLYEHFLPWTDRIYLTIVPGDFDGDTFFPEYKNEWLIHDDEMHEDGLRFLELTPVVF